MRSLLEKAIAHVIHNDLDKGEALFHKYLIQRFRNIHESLRQNEDIGLDDGWENETHEEEYLNNSDLDAAEEPVDDGDDADLDDDNVDADLDDDLDAVETGDEDLEDVDLDGDDVLSDKLDNLEDKIDELTSEFDRLMSTLEDHDDFDSSDDDDDFNKDDVDDVEGEEPHMDSDDSDDLADRMDHDMADDETSPEDVSMESFDMDDEDALDEELADITESVLSELEKVTMPVNGDGRGIGSGGYNVTGATNTDGMLPKHKTNDRVAGAKPYMVTGAANSSFDREMAPAVKPVTSVVKKPRNSRNKWDDDMTRVSKEGDKSSALNTNFAGGEKYSNSPVDGKMKPKTL